MSSTSEHIAHGIRYEALAAITAVISADNHRPESPQFCLENQAFPGAPANDVRDACSGPANSLRNWMNHRRAHSTTDAECMTG